MSARESQSRRRWLFDLLTARVRVLLATMTPFATRERLLTQSLPDAGLFKDAFVKAQQENEALFPKEAVGGAAAAPAAESRTE